MFTPWELKQNAEKWKDFDAAVGVALELWAKRAAWLAERDRFYSTTLYCPRLCSGAGHDWSAEDRQTARELTKAAQDAESHALTLKPPRVHKRTARRRLQSIAAYS